MRLFCRIFKHCVFFKERLIIYMLSVNALCMHSNGQYKTSYGCYGSTRSTEVQFEPFESYFEYVLTIWIIFWICFDHLNRTWWTIRITLWTIWIVFEPFESYFEPFKSYFVNHLNYILNHLNRVLNHILNHLNHIFEIFASHFKPFERLNHVLNPSFIVNRVLKNWNICQDFPNLILNFKKVAKPQGDKN